MGCKNACTLNTTPPPRRQEILSSQSSILFCLPPLLSFILSSPTRLIDLPTLPPPHHTQRASSMAEASVEQPSMTASPPSSSSAPQFSFLSNLLVRLGKRNGGCILRGRGVCGVASTCTNSISSCVRVSRLCAGGRCTCMHQELRSAQEVLRSSAEARSQTQNHFPRQFTCNPFPLPSYASSPRRAARRARRWTCPSFPSTLSRHGTLLKGVIEA